MLTTAIQPVKNFSFYKLFFKYLFVGICSLVLFLGGQQGILGDFKQNGPSLINADDLTEEDGSPIKNDSANPLETVDQSQLRGNGEHGVDINVASPTEATIYNSSTSKFAGGSLTTQFAVYHCSGADGSVCYPGIADYIDSPIPLQDININVPSRGAQASLNPGAALPICGRIQIDYGLSNNRGILGGRVFQASSGVACVQDVPAPIVQPNPNPEQPVQPAPNPCPNGPADAPNLPQNLKVNGQPTGHVFPAGTNKFNLTWEAPISGNPDKYAVRFDNPLTPGTDIDRETTGTSFEITLETPDPIKYGWWVHAGNQCGYGQPAGAELSIAAPAQPNPNPEQPITTTPSCVSLAVSPNPVQMGQNVTITPVVGGLENIRDIKLRFFNYANRDLSNEGWYDIATVTPNQSHTWAIPSTEIGRHFFDMVIYDKQGNVVDWWKNDKCRAAVEISTLNTGQLSCAINVSPTVGTAPLTVQFGSRIDNTRSSTPTYQWDFNGDGTIDSNQSSGSYLFTNAGSYTSRLSVNDGVTTATCTALIALTGAQPQGNVTIKKYVLYNGTEYDDTLAASVKRFGPNETVTYRIKVMNNSNVNVDNVVVRDIPGAYLTASAISWSLGTIPANTPRQIDYTAIVAGTIPAGSTSQLNTATLTVNGQPSGSDSATVMIGRDAQFGEPVLAIEKTPSSQTVNGGGEATFTIKVKNNSGKSVNGIQVIDDLPPGFTYVSGSSTVSTTTNPTTSGATLTWTGINLNDGQEWSVTFRATVPTESKVYFNNAKAIVDNKTFGPVQANVIVNPVGTVLTAAPQVQPQVQIMGVQLLPKTGLPMLAWAAAAFVPLGLKLRRFSRNNLEPVSSNPNYIWEDREFKK